MAEISVTAHEKVLRLIPCVVSDMRPVTLHHCHGGSMKDMQWHVGVAQRQNPFLQIPLHEMYHTGNYGIDSGMGVETWERKFGAQTKHLNSIDALLNYDLWDMVVQWEHENRSKSL